MVVVSDDTESEATDRLSLNLPSAQDELIAAVAAANPHTVVVINAGAPVAMPWLNQVAGVVDAWYPGQSSGTALASVLFGQTDPSGHLPVTFPASLAQVPASTTAQFPGGRDHGPVLRGPRCRLPVVQHKGHPAAVPVRLRPVLHLVQVPRAAGHAGGPGTQDVQVSATVTNTGHRSGADVAQLYVTLPASAGEPPRQLKGFQRVSLRPGQSERVRFTLTPADLSWFDTSAPGASATGGGWSQSAGAYQVYVGDSAALANLPLHGGFVVTSTPGARQVSVSAPATVTAGKPFTVKATLTAAGDQTLRGVRISLQLPQGWTARPSSGSAVFGVVAAGAGPIGHVHGDAAVVRAQQRPGGARHR